MKNQSNNIILLSLIALVVIVLLGAVWYRDTHSMHTAAAFTVNEPSYQRHLLIATQGSPFKDSVVFDIVDRLKSYPVYIQVVDVSSLKDIHEDDWSAIVILHTWENWKPQKDAQEFVSRAQHRDKIVVLSTSGSGNERLEGVDAISSASSLWQASISADTIIRHIDKLLYPVAAHEEYTE